MSALRVQVIRAWARGFEAVDVALAVGACVEDAVAASGLDTSGCDGYAVFGERASAQHPLSDGDRVELLRPLQADPKDARRRRAAAAKRA